LGHSIPLPKPAGGNSILERIGERCTGNNLHAEWDAIPAALGTSATESMLEAARAVAPTFGNVEDFAVAWAGDTVVQAHSAFAGAYLHFCVRCALARAFHQSGRLSGAGNETQAGATG